MSAPPARPGRTRFSPRFWERLDWAVAALCAVAVYGTLFRRVGGVSVWFGPGRMVTWLAVGFSVLLALPVGLRRREPIRAFLLALSTCAVVLAIGGEIIGGAFLSVALVLYMVASISRRVVAVAALGAALAVLVAQGVLLSERGLGSGPATGDALLMIIATLVGITVLQRRTYAARVREQFASEAVTEERLRIARELHDVVAHSMTVVAVQAGFGEYVFDQDPGKARATLGAIQHATSEALSDMQRLLGVLRQDGGARPSESASPQLAPAPGLADLDRLVGTTAGARVRVEVSSTGACRDVPAGIDQSAFRIVQEALTNVVKHSPADVCRVALSYAGSDLSIEVTDPGIGSRTALARPVLPGAEGRVGHGLLGMRERVSLCGGDFSAGSHGAGFRVSARLPLPPAARSGPPALRSVAPTVPLPPPSTAPPSTAPPSTAPPRVAPPSAAEPSPASPGPAASGMAQ